MLPFRNGRSGNWGLAVCLLSILFLSIVLAIEPAIAAKPKGKKEKLLTPTPTASSPSTSRSRTSSPSASGARRPARGRGDRTGTVDGVHRDYWLKPVP